MNVNALSNKTIAKNTLFLYVRMVIVLVVSLFTTRVILNALGATDFGIYNVVGGIVTIMSFLNGALSGSTSRFLTFTLGKGDLNELHKTFASALNLHIIVALLVIIVGETIGLWFFYNKLVIPEDRMTAAFWVYQLSIATTVINFTQIPYTASLISHENMSIYAYVGLYEAFARMLIAYLIVISPIDKLISYAILLAVNTLIVQYFYRFYTRRKYEECKFALVWDKKLYKNLLSYCGWELFGGIASVSQGQGITIVLNMFFGPVVNAARAIVGQIQSALQMFVTNFLTAARPQVIKRCADGDYTSMYSLAFYSARFSYMLMLALILPVCFEIDFILKIWLGDNIPEYTNIFTVIILSTSLFQTIHTASLMPYHAIGKIRSGNLIGGGLMILALPVSYILFMCGFEPYWAFITVFITNGLQQFSTWAIIHNYVEYRYRSLLTDVYLPCIFVTILAFISPAIIYFTIPQGWLRFLILTITSELSMLFIFTYIGLKANERQKIISMIKHKINNE